MTNQFTTRALKLADLQAAAALLETAISTSPHYNAVAKLEEIAAHTPAKLQAQLEVDALSAIGLFEGDQLAGMVVSSVDAGLLWLGWIVVGEAWRGRGLSHVLMRAFEAGVAQRGAHKIWCDSRIGNTASKHLLEQYGYVVAVTLERHWYGLDYYLWEKRIEECSKGEPETYDAAPKNALLTDQTDWQRVEAMPEQLAKAVLRRGIKPTPNKEMLNLRVDNDVLEWWRARGKGYQSEINALLRAVMLEQQRQVR